MDVVAGQGRGVETHPSVLFRFLFGGRSGPWGAGWGGWSGWGGVGVVGVGGVGGVGRSGSGRNRLVEIRGGRGS